MTNLADEERIAMAIRNAVDSIELRGAGPDLALVHLGARRRRRRRLAAVTTGAVAAVAAGALVVTTGWLTAPQAIAPATAHDESATVPVSSLSEDERPVVDADAGVLQLPLDRYQVSWAEGYEIQWAVDLLLADCVADRGIVYEPVDFRTMEHTASRRYGIWTMSQATNLGYGVPPTSEEETRAFASPPSEEVYDEVLLCSRDMQADDSSVFAQLAVPKLDPAAPEGSSTAETSEEGRSAVAEWEACLEAAGIQPPTDGWIPPAAQNVDRQTEIEIAVQDVTCKQQTHLIQRLADLAASYQAPYIRTHGAELDELRRQTDATLALARQVISEHGG